MDVALTLPTPSDKTFRAEVRIALPGGGWRSVDMLMEVVRERRYTTTLDNNFAGVQFAASSLRELMGVMDEIGMWSDTAYSGILAFIRDEAWRIAKPVARMWRKAEIENPAPVLRAGC